MNKKELLSKLKSEEISFNLLEEPPTREIITERLLSLPDYSVQAQKNENMANTMAIILGVIGWLMFNCFIFNGIYRSGIFIDAMFLTLFLSIFDSIVFIIMGVILSVVFTDHNLQEINAEIMKQKNVLNEVEELHYKQIADFCKKSNICNEYKNKVKSQKRNFYNAELDIFEKQVKLEEIEVKKTQEHKSLEEAKSFLFEEDEMNKYSI